ENAATHSGSRRSLRMARICPNLTATGPRSRSSATTASGRGLSSGPSLAAPRPSRAASPFSPWRANNTRICPSRSRSFNAAASARSLLSGSAILGPALNVTALAEPSLLLEPVDDPVEVQDRGIQPRQLFLRQAAERPCHDAVVERKPLLQHRPPRGRNLD